MLKKNDNSKNKYLIFKIPPVIDKNKIKYKQLKELGRFFDHSTTWYFIESLKSQFLYLKNYIK